MSAIALVLLLQQGPPEAAAFLRKHCLDCHEGAEAKGNLDLAALHFEPADPKAFARWVQVHDRVRDGEMPPAKKPRPEGAARAAFLASLAVPLAEADRAREDAEGRSTLRRLNRAEIEHSLRDLLGAPWLQVRGMLPEDGEAHRFNKVGDALDISHVQMAQLLQAAEAALREILPDQVQKPASEVRRFHTRDMPSFANKMKYNEFNRSPERATFPVLGFAGQPDVRSGKQALTAGPADPAVRELEAMGVVAGAYEPLEPKFNVFKAPRSGLYRVRLSGLSVWVGPEKDKWWRPDINVVSKGRRSEPVTLYAERPPRLLRRLGAVDLHPEPSVQELEVVLLEGETIRPDASRLFRSRPPNWHNPLAEKDGQPGVAYRWLEVEGPLVDAWPPAGHRLLFGDLPLREVSGRLEATSGRPEADAERLMHGFLAKAWRRPPPEADVKRLLDLVKRLLGAGQPFQEAMLSGYAAAICSPGFLNLPERPGPLDRDALAARLSYFLWNSPPDEELRAADLAAPGVLEAQASRLLADPRAGRFVDAFLDYWLDLRRIDATSPDAALYPDYYLDDYLQESADLEPRRFFAVLLRENLPARTLISSDFVMVNERLAAHYGLPQVDGAALRRVPVPPGSPRGGLLTMAAVLKVTANGTTTSPVIRGAWVMERILGQAPPPPPKDVPAVEPDIRGAKTIREQLDKHRNLAACAGCHVKIDPPGFALESFDVFGGERSRYRALGEGKHAPGWGKNGQPFEFHDGPPVDASGELPGGRGAFKGIREFKALLLKDERQIARALLSHLVVYATGSPVRFGDRSRVEAILDRSAASGFGIRTLITELVASGLFQRK